MYTWTLKHPDDEFLCNKTGTYEFYPTLDRNVKIGGEWTWIQQPFRGELKKGFFLEFRTPPCDGPIPQFAEGIHIHCGNHRYGRVQDDFLDETLDYPQAYPMVVQVTDGNGNPVDEVDVRFSITQGEATLSRWGFDQGQQFTGETRKVTLGLMSGNDGTEYIQGALDCAVEFEEPGVVAVEAELVSTGEKITFKLRSVEDGEEDDMIAKDGNGNYIDDHRFHERLLDWEEPQYIYKGDGLWGYHVPDPQHPNDKVMMDRDNETKNLRLEIDYMSQLGPLGNWELTPADMEYIYNEVARIFAQIGIELDPLLNLKGEDKIYDPGSVIQKMDENFSEWNNSPEKGYIGGYLTQYTKKDISEILRYTRGEVGDDNPPMGHWIRRRVHIVLLPGKMNPTETEEGHIPEGIASIISAMSDELGEGLASRASSGDENDDDSWAFPWADEDPTSALKPIDQVGICILTGAFASSDEVDGTWKCAKNDEGEPINEYCNIIAYIIAHEVGHAIGLADERDMISQLMNESIGYTKNTVSLSYEDSGCMEVISSTNKLKDYYVNLRKVLGRETTNFYW